MTFSFSYFDTCLMCRLQHFFERIAPFTWCVEWIFLLLGVFLLLILLSQMFLDATQNAYSIPQNPSCPNEPQISALLWGSSQVLMSSRISSRMDLTIYYGISIHISGLQTSLTRAFKSTGLQGTLCTDARHNKKSSVSTALSKCQQMKTLQQLN